MTIRNKKIERSAQDKQTRQRPKRDRAAIQQAMLRAAMTDGAALHATVSRRAADNSETGLTLRALEEKRWSVSPVVAKEKILEAGLPYEGRRAGLIYSWSSIFRLEGIDSDLADSANRTRDPALFEDLLDTTAAASLIGYSDASSIRKLVANSELHPSSYIRFGNRGVYRFRPAPLIAHRMPSLRGRIV